MPKGTKFEGSGKLGLNFKPGWKELPNWFSLSLVWPKGPDTFSVTYQGPNRGQNEAALCGPQNVETKGPNGP